MKLTLPVGKGGAKKGGLKPPPGLSLGGPPAAQSQDKKDSDNEYEPKYTKDEINLLFLAIKVSCQKSCIYLGT